MKDVGLTYDKDKDIDSTLDALILKETDTGAVFKGITCCTYEGYRLFTIVFERASS